MRSFSTHSQDLIVMAKKKARAKAKTKPKLKTKPKSKAKANTPGCTSEGCDIRDRYAEFERNDTVVLGVSRDSIESHEKFKSKFGFPFELVSDPDEKLCRAFDVIRKKSLYGKEYMGVDRS